VVVLYATKIIRVTSKVVRVIVFATMGACAFYLVSLFSVLLGGPNLDGRWSCGGRDFFNTGADCGVNFSHRLVSN